MHERPSTLSRALDFLQRSAARVPSLLTEHLRSHRGGVADGAKPRPRRHFSLRVTTHRHRDLEPRCYLWEVAEIAKKLFLVGFVALIKPGQMVQLIIGFDFCMTFLFVTALYHCCAESRAHLARAHRLSQPDWPKVADVSAGLFYA